MEEYNYDSYQSVDINFMGSTGQKNVGNWFWRLLFEPFVTYEEARDPATGTLWRGAKKLLISYGLEAIGVFFLTLSVAGVAAGCFKSGLNVSLIGFVVGVAHFALRYGVAGWRHTPYLPRNLSPTFTWMRVFYGQMGIVWALCENVVQYGTAALVSAILCSLTLTAGDSWRGVGKFGEAAALGDAGAWLLYSLTLFAFGFVELYNQTITSKRYSYDPRSIHANGLLAAFIIGLTTLSVHWGIYSNNELIAFAGGLSAGTLSDIGNMKWAILFIFGPTTAIALIVFFVWLLWNVNSIPKDRIQDAKNRHRLDGVDGSDGGVPHQMEDRREISNPLKGSLIQNLMAEKKRKGKNQ